MKTILLWLLISVSDGGYNRGNVDVIERFTTQASCEAVMSQIRTSDAKLQCVKAEVARPE